MSEAEDFSVMEFFVIQTVKSVVLPVPYHMRELKDFDIQIKVDNKNLPVVSETMHMGIMRSANTQESAVQENIKKARRTIYSLMGLDCTVRMVLILILPYTYSKHMSSLFWSMGWRLFYLRGSIWTSWIRFTRNS